MNETLKVIAKPAGMFYHSFNQGMIRSTGAKSDGPSASIPYHSPG
jgi:hypothetical protein